MIEVVNHTTKRIVFGKRAAIAEGQQLRLKTNTHAKRGKKNAEMRINGARRSSKSIVASAMEQTIMYGIWNMDMEMEMDMVMVVAFTGSTFTKSFNLDVDKKQRKKDGKASHPFFFITICNRFL